MSELVALTATATAATYRNLIKEVFIDPIRTVVVVDDEFPTLDEYLSDQGQLQNRSESGTDLQRRKLDNTGRVRKILNFCRTQEPRPWIVDVHDGRTPSLDGEQSCASHLDHSDLLILDYHLESDGSGQKAIEILRQLAGNGHFNLVAVYTKDRDEAGGGIDRAVNEIALSLACTIGSPTLKQSGADKLRDKLSPWEDIQTNIYHELLGCIDQIAFLKILERENRRWEALREIPELVPLARYLNEIPPEIELHPDAIILLLMHVRQNDFGEKMSKFPYGRVITGKNSDGVNWIRTDTLFITVISKDHEAGSIPDRLLNALVAWDPTPHRLIMSKMRSELDQQGVAAETGVLNNLHLQVGWLAEILDTDEAKRRTNVRLNVTRHWESLGGKLEPKVVGFAERVGAYLTEREINKSAQKRFDPYDAHEDQEKVFLQLNCHACSKPVEGHHLTTGHVLKIQDGTNIFYWLCLTPACDLVPSQGDSKGWKKRLGSWLPFIAVRLYSADRETALKNATRGYHLFLQIDKGLKTFGFAENTEGQDQEYEKYRDAPVFRWEQMFAENNGQFGDARKLNIASIGIDGSLNHKATQSVVVAQLRYEYALNLMQILGAHLSRIGLDFSSSH